MAISNNMHISDLFLVGIRICNFQLDLESIQRIGDMFENCLHNICDSLNFKCYFAAFLPNAMIEVALSKQVISLRNLFLVWRKIR